ncbi:MAG: TRAP transporter small permease [Planctomycetota bacterium]|nr:TRAP transporter small permease [Planctomycetota bacterium]
MSTLARILGKAAAALEVAVKTAAISVLVSLICVVFFQMARRTLTGRSFVEIEELSIILAAWLAFLTIPYAVRRKAHVRIETFIEKFPFVPRNSLELAINAAILATVLVAAYHGWRLAGRKIMVPMTVLPTHQGVWFYSFPVGMGLAAFFLLDNLAQTLNRFATREPYRLADPSPEIPASGEGVAGRPGNEEG